MDQGAPQWPVRGPLELLDGAFFAVRRGGGRALLRAFLGAAPLAVLALALYFFERVEGVHSLRGPFACAIAAAFCVRSLVLGRVARRYALLLRPSLPVAVERTRAVDVVSTAAIVGLGLWCWMWPLAGLWALSPFAAAAFVPLLSVRGAIAPSWLARSACSRGHGAGAFIEAISDTAGMRGVFLLVELFALGGVLLLWLNISALLSLVLVLSHSMLGFNVAFIGSFLSSSNSLSLLLVTIVTLLLAEPLRAAQSAQAFVDARSRRDGADLHAAVDAILRQEEAASRMADRSSTPGDDGLRSVVVIALASLLSLAPGASPALAQASERAAEPPPVSASDDEAVRSEVERIVSGPEFREFADHESRTLREALRALARFFEELDGESSEVDSSASLPVQVPPELLMALGILVLVLVVLYATSRRVPASERRREVEDAERIAAVPSETHMDEAARLIALGDARGALRALYLATLVALDKGHSIELEPGKTNWQYIRAMPRGEARSLFTSFTEVFDHKWYGEQPATLDDYERCRALCERIVALAAPGAAGAPAAAAGEAR